jgi:hypothetical protein
MIRGNGTGIMIARVSQQIVEVRRLRQSIGCGRRGLGNRDGFRPCGGQFVAQFPIPTAGTGGRQESNRPPMAFAIGTREIPP